ncbi:hypothetical protein F4779DRAFT_5747 [Xylariaceae sp. FL0662B]|nr:hypothetical protein F4779DRAFT_5747 [Xylariaceae sp. FL0662B]
MDRLPQDIYDEIGEHLSKLSVDQHPLAALATLSRRWQGAIERQTFREISVKSTSTDLERFRDIVQHNRRRYARKLNYLIVLPAYSEDARARFEREEDRRANDDVFTTAIHRLFHILKFWDVGKDGYIEFLIKDVYSTSDHEFLVHALFPKRRQAVNLWGFRTDGSAARRVVDLWAWRYMYSYLRLLRSSDLPVVPVITSFWTFPFTRRICDRVAIDIAAKLPNLLEGRWKFNDWEIPYLALRRAHRHDLAQAISNVLPQSSAMSTLQSLHITMASVFFWIPTRYRGNLSLDGATADPLCDALRVTISRMSSLKMLSIYGDIDASFMWPSTGPVPPKPYWQNLQHLSVHFTARRPSGGCYFLEPGDATISANAQVPSDTKMPPGYGFSEEEDIRTVESFSLKDHKFSRDSCHVDVVPDDDSLTPLMEAFGRVCLQLPMIKAAELYSTVPGLDETDHRSHYNYSRSHWGVWYLSPGTIHRGGKEYHDPAFFEDVDQRRLFWDVKSWRPSAHLSSLLRSIGQDRHGNQLVERFVDSWNSVRKKRPL